MAEVRAERAAAVFERLGVRLGPEGLTGVDVGQRVIYGRVPDGVDVDAIRSSLGDEWTTEIGERGVVYDVPTFGVTVHLFDSGVVACVDSADRDLAAAAITAAVTELAATPVEPSAELDLREVSLTAAPNEEWESAYLERVGRRDAGTADGETDTDADADDEPIPTSGVTPSPCSGCGRVPDGWERYCPRCGTDLKPGVCDGCGEPLASWMLYCPACGGDATGPL